MKGARIKWKTHSKWYKRMYEFETPYQYIAFKFLDLINAMDINLVDCETCPDYIGSSSIKFISTKDERIRMEYVFRRMMNIDRLYLTDLTGYQNNREKYFRDHYMIY